MIFHDIEFTGWVIHTSRADALVCIYIYSYVPFRQIILFLQHNMINSFLIFGLVTTLYISLK